MRVPTDVDEPPRKRRSVTMRRNRRDSGPTWRRHCHVDGGPKPWRRTRTGRASTAPGWKRQQWTLVVPPSRGTDASTIGWDLEADVSLAEAFAPPSPISSGDSRNGIR
jgi:hypothetical protein